jgi:hypothetical protein
MFFDHPTLKHLFHKKKKESTLGLIRWIFLVTKELPSKFSKAQLNKLKYDERIMFGMGLIYGTFILIML